MCQAGNSDELKQVSDIYLTEGRLPGTLRKGQQKRKEWFVRRLMKSGDLQFKHVLCSVTYRDFCENNGNVSRE